MDPYKETNIDNKKPNYRGAFYIRYSFFRKIFDFFVRVKNFFKKFGFGIFLVSTIFAIFGMVFYGISKTCSCNQPKPVETIQMKDMCLK